PRHSGVKPAIAVVGERAGFIEQHHIVPLRGTCPTMRETPGSIGYLGRPPAQELALGRSWAGSAPFSAPVATAKGGKGCPRSGLPSFLWSLGCGSFGLGRGCRARCGGGRAPNVANQAPPYGPCLAMATIPTRGNRGSIRPLDLLERQPQ